MTRTGHLLAQCTASPTGDCALPHPTCADRGRAATIGCIQHLLLLHRRGLEHPCRGAAWPCLGPGVFGATSRAGSTVLRPQVQGACGEAGRELTGSSSDRLINLDFFFFSLSLSNLCLSQGCKTAFYCCLLDGCSLLLRCRDLSLHFALIGLEV